MVRELWEFTMNVKVKLNCEYENWLRQERGDIESKCRRIIEGQLMVTRGQKRCNTDDDSHWE